MYSEAGELLYVGKARSLRDRVGNYFLASNVDPKVQALVGHIARIEVTLTNSETEALLLEYNLIKEHKPRYNIVLRDDKSFPAISIYRRATSIRGLVFYRGSRNLPGRYFGPFPSAGAVKETLQSVQKIFRIRNCRDTFFENRSRPCLQHQIGRCSAPCVKLISREDYARDIAAAVKVLEGRNDEVFTRTRARHGAGRRSLQYERAAALRDQLAALKQVQAQQIVTAEGDRDIDVFALVGEPGEFAISVMIIRGGRNLGVDQLLSQGCAGRADEALASFLMQYYAETPPPRGNPREPRAGGSRGAGRRARRTRRHGHAVVAAVARAARALDGDDGGERHAGACACAARAARTSARCSIDAGAVASTRPRTPQRLECFDISHTAGEGTGRFVRGLRPRRAHEEGVPALQHHRRDARRRLRRAAPGAASAAMNASEPAKCRAPDVLLIDGGLGPDQRGVCRTRAAGICRSEARGRGEGAGSQGRPGASVRPRRCRRHRARPDSQALRVIQRIRDEAHRFAITGHRKRRARRHNESVLETVPGLGPAKRRALLRHFGGMQGLLRAGVTDFEAVSGIGTTLARTLYDHLHPGA